MSLDLRKRAIDIGIVVRDGGAALRFYRDTLGLEPGPVIPMRGMKMYRLLCGDTTVKIVVPDALPAASAAPGGIQGATGVRYWTISVADLDRVVADCRSGGYAVPVPPREIRPGVSIAMVEDPEGNWVELLQSG